MQPQRPVDGLPDLDPAQLRSLLDLGADPALVQELIALHAADGPERIRALEAAVSAGDAARGATEAHQLKGSVGNLGLVRLAELARQLEQAGREGSLEGATDLAARLPAALVASLEALRAAFPA